jgi:Toprim domain-containing protein
MTALDLRTIARALGGEVSGRRVLAPGPQHSPKDRSLCVSLAPALPGGFLVHSFAGDDPIQCKDYVRARLGLPAWQPGDEQDRRIHLSPIKDGDRTTVDAQVGLRERTEDDLLHIKRTQALWNEATSPHGTTAVQYLMTRALDLPDDLAGAVLRFHPRCPWRNEDTGRTERIPALLAAFRSIDDHEITAVHRVRLDQPQRWPKADRRMLGLVRHAAVKLDPVATTLIIGEGVETCMAARQCMATGDIERAPIWALGSVGAISFFPVINDVRRLIILGERGEASAQAVRLCGQRWQHAGRGVQVLYSEIGSDVNDALMMERIAQ